MTRLTLTLLIAFAAEAATAAEARRPEFEAIARELHASDNKYLGYRPVERLVETLQGDLPDDQRIEALLQLAVHRTQFGELEAAVELLDACDELVDTETPRRLRAQLARTRGIVYLRIAERQNCVLGSSPDRCLFPLAGGGVHRHREPARTARSAYLLFLRFFPYDVTSRWILNILSMAIGDYPEGVEPRYRLPPLPLPAREAVGRFVDVAPAAGVAAVNNCGGVVVDDFDRDGRLDIVTSTFDPEGPLLHFRSAGDGTFEDVSTRSRTDDQLGGLNLVGTDYDDDGLVDLLVLRGAWLLEDGRIRNSLLRQREDGTFVDVTHAAGIAEPAYPTQAAAWADFDNDGDLDLFVANESRPEEGRDYPAQLFRNNGDGTFTDVARQAGVTNDRYGKGVAVGDYDNDGDVDLYVSNVGPNRLYRNNGDLTFTDVAVELQVTRPERRSFATWFFDYDNDGWLDLFAAAYLATVADVAADLVGAPFRAPPPRLYRNNRDGTFSDVTDAAGLHHAYLPMGANFGDIDNDGWLDIYLTTGDPGFETLVPNVMLRNVGGRRFEDVTRSAGLGHLQKGHGVAFADFDGDGDQDIYHQLGGFYPGDDFPNALFVNPGGGGRSLVLELEGTTSNRRAYGARVTVSVRTPAGQREIHRAVGSVSSFGGSPARQEIGLGDALAIHRVDIWWPASGERQSFEGLELDAGYRIVEGAVEAVPIALQRFRWPGSTTGSAAHDSSRPGHGHPTGD